MLPTVFITALCFSIAFCADKVDHGEPDAKSGAQPKYWRAILGDICQLPSFPRATGDPIRYVECVRQSTDITDRKDLGIWLLRECLPGYEFVASARRCKTIRSVKRQQELCDGPNAQNYQFCPETVDSNEHFIIHEIRQAPKQCACPNGEKNCVCPSPEILQPQLVKSKLVRRNVATNGAPAATIQICAVCPSSLTSCYCPTNGQTQPTQQQPAGQQQPTQVVQQPSPQWDSYKQPGMIPPPSPELQRPAQQQPTPVVQQQPQQPTQVVQQQPAGGANAQCPCPETACVCISIGVDQGGQQSGNGVAQQQPQQTTQSPYTQQQQANCQTTTTNQQYCPQNNQEQYIVQPQPCPLVQGQSTANAQYQGICSWMVDPLATDSQSASHYLQCQPAPNNLFCGRWQRMPCAPGTVFDVNSQVCVWDPNATAMPGTLPPAQAPTQGPIQQYQPTNGQNGSGQNGSAGQTPVPVVSLPQSGTCSCTGGVQIGSCNVNYQCPGQSVCQVGGQPGAQQCMVCCYFHQQKQ